MTIDKLLSGLLGALVGALIVVRAEQWRWRRENKAAARLLYYEVIHNLAWLKPLADLPEGVADYQLSRSVWDRSKSASVVLKSEELNLIAAAYVDMSIVLATRQGMDLAAWREWVKKEEGAKQIATTRDMFAASNRA
jgi:hypothetical protein